MLTKRLFMCLNTLHTKLLFIDYMTRFSIHCTFEVIMNQNKQPL
jgi:hypothetical protein